MKNLLSLAIVSLLCSFPSFSKSFIVKRKIKQINVIPEEIALASFGIQVEKPLVQDLGIYLINVPEVKGGGFTSLRTSLLSTGEFEYIQEDHPVTQRLVSADPRFYDQWSINGDGEFGIGASEAWSYSTGGTDAAGNDIVVAVVEEGISITHEDLKDNIWINKGEIPKNKIDDDNNGYVDDYYGYDSAPSVPTGESHGTHVAGIIGAKGDNDKHIAGINWDVKLMPVLMKTFSTSSVLASYGYVLKQKKIWLESKGQAGANVVAVNSSFGINGADCNSEKYPLWNDIYNEMGKLGIVNVVATANRAWNVDNVGDVPSGCSSDYIISVTNTDEDGKIYGQAGFGQKFIDLGAPGTEIYSTIPYNMVGGMTGTSMATPHVTGSVALLHAIAPRNVNNRYYNDPAGFALFIKKIVLQTVAPEQSLKGKTVSGGRLDLGAAAKKILE